MGGKAFPLGSPLVPDISRQVLNLTEGENMRAIENKWSVGEKYYLERNTSDTPIQLDHHSFQALFMIVFGISLLLLFLMLSCRRYQEREGNITGGPNHPGDGPGGQANTGANQNRDVNEGGEQANAVVNVGGGNDELGDSEHHIVEVTEGGNVGVGDESDHTVEGSEEDNVGDGDESDHIVEVNEESNAGKVNEVPTVQLQRQKSQPGLVHRRTKKLISKTMSMPLRRAAPPSRMHLA